MTEPRAAGTVSGGFLPWNRDYPAVDTVHLAAERVIPAFR